MNTGERMNAILEDLALTRNAFAGSIGVSATAINGIVANTVNPGHKIVTGIKKNFPQYNTEWLLTGKGEMKTNIGEKSNFGSEYLQEYMVRLEENFKVLAEQSKMVADQFANQLAVKDRQLESLQKTVDILLGKYDLSENTPCDKERRMYSDLVA